jgi:hypothetical protein
VGGLDHLSDAQKGESIVSLVRLFFFSDGLVDFAEIRSEQSGR